MIPPFSLFDSNSGFDKDSFVFSQRCQGLRSDPFHHDYHLIAQAAAIRLIDLAGDEGIRMLQSGITDAVEAGQTESLALALRDAEIHKFELARLW